MFYLIMGPVYDNYMYISHHFMKFYENMQKIRGERNLGTEKYPTM